MSMTYDVVHHELLEPTLKVMEAAELTPWAEAAERLQRLRGTTFSGDDAETAALVVVFQLNKLKSAGISLSEIASIGRGGRSWSYKTSGGGTAIILDERASQLREDLGSWAVGDSLR